MKQNHLWMLLTGFSLLITAAYGAEKQIKKTDMPAVVQKTADEQSAGAAVRGYAKDTEDGKLEYEVELVSNGHTKDVTIDPQGNVLEVEEQVALDAVPANVRDRLQMRAGKGRITKVESLTKKGNIVAYEAQVMTGGRYSEIQVGPHGEKLEHEE
ncbi:MAG TPA: PepSY domain-containing protein [Alloacidobacterium sp.]|nr:PepSY domain-containing protein [Alloacidobacterium sp.]